MLEDNFQPAVGKKNPKSLWVEGEETYNRGGWGWIRFAGQSTEKRETAQRAPEIRRGSSRYLVRILLAYRKHDQNRVNQTTLHRTGGEKQQYTLVRSYTVCLVAWQLKLKVCIINPRIAPIHSLQEFCPQTFLLFSPYSTVLIMGIRHSFRQT